MQRVNQLLTILILIIFASAGWFLIVQTILVRQGVIPPIGRTPDFRRVGALAELEPVPTPPPLLDIDPERTDRSDAGDTIALKLTTNIPLGHQFAGGEVFTVRILATPKYRGQLNNMLHLEGIRFPIRYNKDFLQLKVLPSGLGVKLDDTDLSEECSFYELAEPSVFIINNIDSFNSFYVHKKFPRSDPRYSDPTKGIQLQPNTCIGEVKFQVIRKEQIDPALLTTMFIDAQVMIPNVAREIGVDGRGPEGTFPDGTLIGNIDLNEHLEWRISNGQVVGTFALGHHLKAPQGINPTSNVATDTPPANATPTGGTGGNTPTVTRAPTPTTPGTGPTNTPTRTPTPTTPGTGPTNTPNPTITLSPTATITPAPFTSCAQQTQIPPAECDTLISLYDMTGGASWYNNVQRWKESANPCEWYGVTCSGASQHVTELNLISNNLVGELPTMLTPLSFLQSLRLDDNQLSGSFPTSFTRMTALHHLSISNNKLTGEIPWDFGSIPLALQSLYIDNNELAGIIPVNFGNLTQLRNLGVGANHFTNVGATSVCSVMRYAEQTPTPWWQLQRPPILFDPCPPPPTPTPTDIRPPLQPVAALVEDTPTPTPYYIDLPPQNAQWPLLWLDREGEHIYTVPINYDKPQVNETYPDLTVVSMSLYSDPEVATCTIELETKIRNNGQTAALPFSVKANGQTYRVLTGLAPGRELTLRFSDYTHGTFMQPNIVRVDSESEVPELREDNNIMERYLFLGSILKPECQNITPPPAGTVTPGSITNIPLDMRKVNIRMKVKLQGIRQETFARQYARLRFGVAVGQVGGVNTDFTQSEFVHLGSGVYEGLITFDPLVVPRGTNYKIMVKGPKHLSKRFCSAQASGDDYYCGENAGGIVLNIGVQDFDYSTVPMAPGDLPFGGQQDGIVDSSDLTFIREHLPSKDAETLRVGDLNFDGIIDTQDFSLVVNNLVNNEDER